MYQGSEIWMNEGMEDDKSPFLDLKAIKNLVKQGEGHRLEFKMKVKFPEKIIKEMVAFANTDGGTLLVGVSDEGQVQGVKFVDEEQFLLDRAIEKYCFPVFSYTNYRVEIDSQRAILVYHIFPSIDKPHFVQLTDEPQPKCYVRIKDRTVQASKEMKQILRRENEEGIQFNFGPSEKWLMEYLHENQQITLALFAEKQSLPLWLASRKLVLLVLARVLCILPGEVYDIYTLR
ncbi:AlbA family DNA-binding domain-containing protein [Aquirufa aurantiipilula]